MNKSRFYECTKPCASRSRLYGAAIIIYLQTVNLPENLNLDKQGFDFGIKTFEGISNVLRILKFEASDSAANQQADRVEVLEFEIDDQSLEELDLRLRSVDTDVDFRVVHKLSYLLLVIRARGPHDYSKMCLRDLQRSYLLPVSKEPGAHRATVNGLWLLPKVGLNLPV